MDAPPWEIVQSPTFAESIDKYENSDDRLRKIEELIIWLLKCDPTVLETVSGFQTLKMVKTTGNPVYRVLFKISDYTVELLYLEPIE